jgi:hypothetical protein
MHSFNIRWARFRLNLWLYHVGAVDAAIVCIPRTMRAASILETVGDIGQHTLRPLTGLIPLFSAREFGEGGIRLLRRTPSSGGGALSGAASRHPWKRDGN